MAGQHSDPARLPHYQFIGLVLAQPGAGWLGVGYLQQSGLTTLRLTWTMAARALDHCKIAPLTEGQAL